MKRLQVIVLSGCAGLASCHGASEAGPDASPAPADAAVDAEVSAGPGVWSEELALGTIPPDDLGRDPRPDVAVNRRGLAMIVVAVHASNENRLRAWRLPEGDAPAPLDPLDDRYNPAPPAFVGLDDAGNAAVAGDGASARRFDVATGWGASELIDCGGRHCYGTGIDVTGDGRIMIAMHRDPHIEMVEGCALVAMSAPGMPWAISRTRRCNACRVMTGSVALSEVSDRFVFPATVAEYGRPDYGPYAVYVRSNLPNGTTLELADTFSYLGVDADLSEAGPAIVTMQQALHDGEQHVMVSTYVDGWAPPMPVDTGGGLAAASALDMDAHGDAVVVWRECTAGTCAVWQRRFVERAWQAAQPLSAPGVDVGADALVDVASDDQRRTLVVWTQPVGGVSAIMAAELVEGAWSPPHALNPADGIARTNPVIDLGAAGHGVAAWMAGNDLRCARYLD